MGENKNNPNSSIDSTNIFEDFTSDKELGEEIKKQEEKNARDIFYYLKLFTNIFKIGNLILFLCILLFFTYSFFQNKETSQNYEFLSPVCQFILGDVSTDVSGCYGVTAFLKTTTQKFDDLKVKQFNKIQPLFEHVYALENFTTSKSVTFLLNRSKNRLKPLSILSDFDKLKNKFEGIDKSQIVCYDIVIRENMTFDARCDAYSSDWDSGIATTDASKKIGGTSISIASSFISFIEDSEARSFESIKYDDDDRDQDAYFKIINKQKIFYHTNVSGNGIYTKKTNFDLNLRYVDPNNLSL